MSLLTGCTLCAQAAVSSRAPTVPRSSAGAHNGTLPKVYRIESRLYHSASIGYSCGPVRQPLRVVPPVAAVLPADAGQPLWVHRARRRTQVGFNEPLWSGLAVCGDHQGFGVSAVPARLGGGKDPTAAFTFGIGGAGGPPWGHPPPTGRVCASHNGVTTHLTRRAAPATVIFPFADSIDVIDA